MAAKDLDYLSVNDLTVKGVLTAEGSFIGSSALPTRYVEGLLANYATDSTLTVGVGSCRNDADDGDIALSAEITLDYASTGALGVEEKNLTGTVTTTTSSASVTGSGTAFLTDFGTKSATGTISSTGTALTGTGSKFLTEVAVNDLIGNAANGYSHVNSIESDTALTLQSAIPGGDLSSVSDALIMEQVLFEAANGEQSQVDTITSDTALALNNTIVTGSAGTAKAGVAVQSGSNVSVKWYSIWVVKGSSGVSGVISTQRTTLLNAPTGYTDSQRRVGYVFVDIAHDFLRFTTTEYGVFGRYVDYHDADDSAPFKVLDTASSLTYANVDASLPCPPSATHALLTVRLSATGSLSAYFRPRNGIGPATTTRTRSIVGSANNEAPTTAFPMPMDGAQVFQYVTDSVVNGDIRRVHVSGYIERL